MTASRTTVGRRPGPSEALAGRRPIPALEELTGELDDAGAFDTRPGAGATGAHLFGADALAVRGLLRYAGSSAGRLVRRVRPRR